MAFAAAPAADTQELPRSLHTPIGTLSFVHLFEARPPAQGAEPRFSMNLILTPEAQEASEWVQIKKAVMQVALSEFGQQALDQIRAGKIRLPWRNAHDRDYAGYKDAPEGTIFIQPWTKNKPGVIDARKNEILVPDDVWAGQLARCTVSVFAYSNSGNRGISFGLNNVQICKKDMPRIDGRRSAAQEFDAVDEGGAAFDDDIPF